MNIAMILAGGRGNRMRSETPKQYMMLAGKPVLRWYVEAFAACEKIDGFLIVCPTEDREWIRENVIMLCEDAVREKWIGFAENGKERYQSSWNGLQMVEGMFRGETVTVLIHDAARPGVSTEMILEILRQTEMYGAVIPMIPVKDTIKVVQDGVIVETPDRATLFAAQTPQAFDLSAIMEAYEAMFRSGGEHAITDDAQVMERYGTLPVHLCPGDEMNLKLTVPEDLQRMEQLLREKHYSADA